MPLGTVGIRGSTACELLNLVFMRNRMAAAVFLSDLCVNKSYLRDVPAHG